MGEGKGRGFRNWYDRCGRRPETVDADLVGAEVTGAESLSRSQRSVDGLEGPLRTVDYLLRSGARTTLNFYTCCH